jgi:regulator of replication initiation timing
MSDLAKRFNWLIEAMHQLQLENNNLRESLWKLQVEMLMELKEEKTNSPPASTNLLLVEPGLS